MIKDAYAIDSCSGFLNCLDTGFGSQPLLGPDLPTRLINVILPIVFGLAGFIAVIIIIISGIQFTTSSGNPEAAGAARSRLVYALIGLGVIILSYVILQIVDTLFLNSGVV